MFTKIAWKTWSYNLYVTELYFSSSIGFQVIWQKSSLTFHCLEAAWDTLYYEKPQSLRSAHAPSWQAPALPPGGDHFSLWILWLFSSACWLIGVYLPDLQDCRCRIFSSSPRQPAEYLFSSHSRQTELRKFPDLWLGIRSLISLEFFLTYGFPYPYWCLYFLCVACAPC